MMALLAGLLSVMLSSGFQVQPQSTQAPVDLEDISVLGLSTREQTQQFVGRIATAPAGARIGRWHDPLCISVANMTAPHGQMLVDRIAELARELDVKVSPSGCRSNVLIVATDDGAAMAEAMVERWRLRFRPPIDNTNMGLAALDRFRTGDAPVRWWPVALPVSVDTGQPVARVTGEHRAPIYYARNVSRLRSAVRYDLRSVTVIIDMTKTGDITLQSLMDYTAMVVLAQVNPRSDYSNQPTIMNLFDNPDDITQMTEWDRLYLQALYDSEVDRPTPSAQVAAVVEHVERFRRRSPTSQDRFSEVD